MATTAWVMGSYADLAAAEITVTVVGTGGETCTITAGDYYVWDATDSISLADALCTAIKTHSVVSNATCVPLESGKLKLVVTTTGGNWSLAWGSSGATARDLLGWDGDISATASGSGDTAALYSPLFWSPGKTESPGLAPLGATGAEASDIAYGMSGTTVGVATEHNTWRVNQFSWANVIYDRFHTSDELGGEYFRLWQYLKKLAKWKLYRNVEENRSGSSNASLGTPLGPYMLRVDRKSGLTQFPFERSRGFEWADMWNSVTLDAVSTTELDNS